MSDLFSAIIDIIGISEDNTFYAVLLKLLIALLLSFAIFFLAKRAMVVVIKRLHSKWGVALQDTKFFSKLLFVIPSLIFEFLVKDISDTVYIERVAEIWVVIAMYMALLAMLDGVARIYSVYEVSRNRPITALVQVLKIVLTTLMVIVIVSILIQKSPVKLLYGLGAFTAVLLLVFKDTILGFVSGVQLMSNKMLSIGDWIVLPNGDADGEVQEINLYTVKVKNWDLTISTIPTNQLIAQPFVNWRGMQQSGGRRIKRSIYIDISSIALLDSGKMEKLKDLEPLKEYMKDIPLDVNTNIGAFREYLVSWLSGHEKINQNMTLMVRQLQSTPNGLPLEIYCFSKEKEWVAYEKVQSDMFDYIFSVAPLFDIKIYQYPAIVFSK